VAGRPKPPSRLALAAAGPREPVPFPTKAPPPCVAVFDVKTWSVSAPSWLDRRSAPPPSRTASFPVNVRSVIVADERSSPKIAPPTELAAVVSWSVNVARVEFAVPTVLRPHSPGERPRSDTAPQQVRKDLPRAQLVTIMTTTADFSQSWT
jgi:hypothetical protein